MEKQLGKHEVARKLYQRGMEANPHLASLYNSWGSMERSLGKIGKARTLFETGLEKDPKSVRLHLSLAILEDVSGNTEAARCILNKGISIEYENAHLHHALGLLEYKRHELGEAREQFRVAVEVDPGFTMAWLSWGRMEEELGNLQLARSRYREGCQTPGGRGSVQLWQAWAR
jgi:Tfp pilus assembly protein PilF